jgi:transcription antitermination factor NusG
MKSYCVFCKTGFEKDVAQRLNTIDNRIEAMAPTRVLQEKRKGIWEQRELILIPSYVFLYAEEEIKVNLKAEVSDVYKLLEYGTGFRELHGMDYEYAMWIYRHQGNIDISKVLTEGRSVKVLDGPLLDAFGTIVRLDKHKRKVWIEFDFDGVKRIVLLSAECVGKVES